MRFLPGSKNALVTLALTALLFTPALLAGCKNEQQKETEKTVDEGDKAMKLSDEELQKKAYAIVGQKGHNIDKMTPEEKGIYGAAIRKGLL